ncbi:protein-tyrosine phosphatase [Saccharomonospora amisosensis]|uniref:Protein-tyrosine phosphatase n=1 Tax=Saccharomonospora amisosensis TaxID=1128677 RepID=A0A7X5UVI0_9PSEU|nr:protein-tyrosine phosphatase family protein [Saccharomonospora amisosensis]NIJ15004.1 protein-tyrosine phosphatase [Saccharomonospora amisosensis]
MGEAATLPNSVQLPDGAWVRGRGLRRPVQGGPTPDYGLYLGGTRLRRRHEDSLHWPHDWVHWPDGWLPTDWQSAADSLVRLHERALAGESVEIACHGGLGRTGTAVACLVTLCGLTPGAAARWAREHYNRRAVELPWQRLWIHWFAKRSRAAR